jgi:hypothetical protein
VNCTLLLLSQQLLHIASILSEIMSNRGVGDDRINTKQSMRNQQQRLPSFIPVGSSKVSAAPRARLSKPSNNSLLKVYKINQFLLRSDLGTILMYVPCILYSLLSRPTNAQHIFVNNIIYIYTLMIYKILLVNMCSVFFFWSG